MAFLWVSRNGSYSGSIYDCNSGRHLDNDICIIQAFLFWNRRNHRLKPDFHLHLSPVGDAIFQRINLHFLRNPIILVLRIILISVLS